MTTFRDLLLLWPSLGVLARDIGRPYDTCAAWYRRNSVPPQHWHAVIASARKRRVKGVTLATLLDAAQGRMHSPTSAECT